MIASWPDGTGSPPSGHFSYSALSQNGSSLAVPPLPTIAAVVTHLACVKQGVWIPLRWGLWEFVSGDKMSDAMRYLVLFLLITPALADQPCVVLSSTER